MTPDAQDVSLSLKGKVAIISGSGKENGIGAGIAKTLAAAGARVAINYVSESTAPRSEKVVADIEGVAGKGSVIVIRADTSTQDGTEKLVRETMKSFGTDKIDILVNNAATGSMSPLLGLDPAVIEKTFAVNVFGFLHLIRSTVPHMPAGGRIINIGTVVSKLATPNWGVFAASKAAMDTITFVLASELGRDGKGITVNTVAPGPVETDSLPPIPEAQAFKDWLVSLTRAEERPGTVNDIADAVLLLVNERSRWISGQVISVSGGITGA